MSTVPYSSHLSFRASLTHTLCSHLQVRRCSSVEMARQTHSSYQRNGSGTASIARHERLPSSPPVHARPLMIFDPARSFSMWDWRGSPWGARLMTDKDVTSTLRLRTWNSGTARLRNNLSLGDHSGLSTCSRCR